MLWYWGKYKAPLGQMETILLERKIVCTSVINKIGIIKSDYDSGSTAQTHVHTYIHIHTQRKKKKKTSIRRNNRRENFPSTI